MIIMIIIIITKKIIIIVNSRSLCWYTWHGHAIVRGTRPACKAYTWQYCSPNSITWTKIPNSIADHTLVWKLNGMAGFYSTWIEPLSHSTGSLRPLQPRSQYLDALDLAEGSYTRSEKYALRIGLETDFVPKIESSYFRNTEFGNNKVVALKAFRHSTKRRQVPGNN